MPQVMPQRPQSQLLLFSCFLVVFVLLLAMAIVSDDAFDIFYLDSLSAINRETILAELIGSDTEDEVESDTEDVSDDAFDIFYLDSLSAIDRETFLAELIGSDTEDEVESDTEDERRNDAGKNRAMEEIRRETALYCWRNKRADGWMETAPKDNKSRKQLVREAGEEHQLKTGKKLKRPAKSLPILVVGVPGGKRFKKNEVPGMPNDAIYTIVYHQPNPREIKRRRDARAERAYWSKLYAESVGARQSGETIRKEMRDRKRKYHFSEDPPLIHTYERPVICKDKLFWPSPKDFAVANRMAFRFAKQLADEQQQTQKSSTTAAVQTSVTGGMISETAKACARKQKIIAEMAKACTRKQNEIKALQKMNAELQKKTTERNLRSPTTPSAKLQSPPILNLRSRKIYLPLHPPNPSAKSQSPLPRYVSKRTAPFEARADGDTTETEDEEEYGRVGVTATSRSQEVKRTSKGKTKKTKSKASTGIPRTDCPLFQPKKKLKPVIWDNIDLVGTADSLPETLTSAYSSRFYCRLCDREFPYSPCSSSQLRRHLKQRHGVDI
jgi:hypothetical protein